MPVVAGSDSARDWIAFMSTSTSVEKSTSSAVLSCEVPAAAVVPVPVPLLDAAAEDDAPDPDSGIDFARASLPAWLMAFLAGRMSGIPWNGGGSEGSRGGWE